MLLKHFFLGTALAILLILSIQFVHADLSCHIAGTCTDTFILMLKNETGGYNNAHAQLPSYDPAYDYGVCCNATGQEVLTSCGGEGAEEFLRLWNETNAHVQDPKGSFPVTYNYSACIAGSSSISCTVQVGSCDPGFECLVSMAGSEGNNFTNAHVAECGYYQMSVCCSFKSPPGQISLIYPLSHHEVTDRFTVFNWTEPDNPDNYTLEYEVEVIPPEGGFGCFGFNDTVPDTNISSGVELCTTFDHSNNSYTWRARACDEFDCGNWSEWGYFNVTPVNMISLISNSSDFGLLELESNYSTVEGDAEPFLLENQGNIRIDITGYATQALFDSFDLDHESFQFMAGVNQSNAFNESGSVLDWINVRNTSDSLVSSLKYFTGEQRANFHLRVSVPPLEPPGAKSTSIMLESTPSAPT